MRYTDIIPIKSKGVKLGDTCEISIVGANKKQKYICGTNRYGELVWIHESYFTPKF